MWGNNAILYVFIVFLQFNSILFGKFMFLKNETTLKRQLNRLCNSIILIAKKDYDTPEIIFFYVLSLFVIINMCGMFKFQPCAMVTWWPMQPLLLHHLERKECFCVSWKYKPSAVIVEGNFSLPSEVQILLVSANFWSSYLGEPRWWLVWW